MTIRRIAALVALALVVSACAEGTGSGGELQGTRWVVSSYLQDGSLAIVPESVYADADFRAQRVTGTGGCNDYDAVYRAGGRTLLVSSPAVTLRACDEATMSFEQTYLGLLQQARFYSVRRGRLEVFDAQRTNILVFDSAPQNPLLGRWVVEGYQSTPNTQVAVLEGTELTVTFGITGSAASPDATPSTGPTGRTAPSSGSGDWRPPG
jgi:heat shock protein HslJ